MSHRSPPRSGSATSRSPTGSCSRRWPGSATGSCACRRAATAPAWRSRRWSRASRSATATSAPCGEMLRIHPDEHPVSIQLFGPDPEVMRGAAAIAAEAGADLIDINMGCPVPKVCKTGAGAALLRDPDRAVAVATRGDRGLGPAGDREAALGPRARRPLGLRAGAAPRRRRRGRRRSASTRARRRSTTRAAPTTRSPASWSRRSTCRWSSPAGCARAGAAPRAYAESGADAVMIARGGARAALDLRGADRAAATSRRRAPRSSPSCAGCSTAARSTGGRSARRATCASSTPGIWSGSGVTGPTPTPTSAPRRSTRSGMLDGSRRRRRPRHAAGRRGSCWPPGQALSRPEPSRASL